MNEQQNENVGQYARETIENLTQAYALAAREAAVRLRDDTQIEAERMRLEAEFRRVQLRMGAVTAMLQVIGAARREIEAEMADADEATRQGMRAHLLALQAQQTGILKSIGVSKDIAAEAVKQPLAIEDKTEAAPVYKRSGRAFKRVPAESNGVQH